jgi:uncharacterized membrane protein
MLLAPACSSPTSSASGGCGSGTTLLRRIPIVKSIYSSVKQVSDTLFSTNGNAFREGGAGAVPAPGRWTIAFVTGKPGGEVAATWPGDYVSVYVPTTPNPTSGFFLMMPRATCVPLRHERGRGAEVRHLHGRGGAARAAEAAAAAAPRN